MFMALRSLDHPSARITAQLVLGHRSCLHGTVQFCTFGLVTAYAANPLRSACHFHQETVSWTLAHEDSVGCNA
jgi:hypothetical protein